MRPPRNRIEALLGDLGAQLQPGVALRSPAQGRGDPHRHPSGLDVIDELLDGGFARGDLGEITGPVSSGRTSLLFALLAHTTTGGGGHRHGELAAVVDPSDAFDPPSARAAGVDLRRILWARAGAWREAMRCTERLLETEGLPFVILDLASGPASPARPHGEPEIPASAWTRLARRAATTQTALIVLSHRRQAGSEARIVLELQPARARFVGSPPLLEEIETRAVLVRHRGGVGGRSVLIRFGGPLRAPASTG
jgi:hypothetical protein